MPVSSRAVAALGWLITALSLTAFVVLMIAGRGLGGRAPTWDASRFVPLAAAPPAGASRASAPARSAPPTGASPASAPAPSAPLWLVAVNLGCPHCRASLPAVVALAGRERPEPAVAALLVDTAERPPADSVATLPLAVAWWDSAQVWRRLWRRSAYGEVLVFGSDGRLLRAIPPMAAP